MRDEAVNPPTVSRRSTEKVIQFLAADRFKQHAKIGPVEMPWTEELERRRRAVARWRGDDLPS